MTDRRITFGWFLPTWGDTEAYGDPSKFTPPGTELFDDVVAACDDGSYAYLLLPVSPMCWEATVIGAYYLARTRHVAPLIAIRAGYQNPTQSAKMFATLDRLSGGRLCINLIAGISDRETAADGIHDSKAVRYEKMDEEVAVMKLLWTSSTRAAFKGRHYDINAIVEPKPVQQPHPPFYLGGGSPEAARVSARHASVHLFWGEKPAVVATNIRAMRDLAANFDRRNELQFGMRLQVVMRDSEEEAWAAAQALIAGAPPLVDRDDRSRDSRDMQAIRGTSAANTRVWDLLTESGADMRIHPHLWTGIATVRPGAGIAVVGTPKQVAATIEEFVDAGCSSFCFSGYPHARAARDFAAKVIRPYFS